MAEEVFSVDSDRAVLKDEPLLNGLSELQTKQVRLGYADLTPMAVGLIFASLGWLKQIAENLKVLPRTPLVSVLSV